MTRSMTRATMAVVLLAALAPLPASAGRGAFLPTYHPAPCTGDECRADDPKSGTPCQGFLCGFVPAKAMQPPVTAAQAAEMERARAAAAAQPAAAPPVPAPARKKRAAKTKTSTKQPVATPAPPAAAVPAQAH